ncbi:MAG TPA: DUF72 domain-containing protein, partial [Candidatus Acidoferrum sp.]
PAGRKYAIEIRNQEWLDAEFADLLRQHRIALVLQDLFYMPRADELAKKFDPITADWTYIRWLGDRKGIEQRTMTWDKTIVDRTKELTSWVDFCYQTKRRGVTVYAYANNHYAGHGPATVRHFRDLWRKKGFPELPLPQPSPPQPPPPAEPSSNPPAKRSAKQSRKQSRKQSPKQSPKQPSLFD